MLRVHDLALLAIFVALKIWLLFSWPLLGDEAYWIGLGHHMDIGYYDHPPMVGWVAAAMQLYGQDLVWLRSIGLLSSAILAWGIYLLLGVAEPSLVFRRRHFLAALAFFVSPASLALLTLSPQLLLALFGFLGVAFYAVAILQRSLFWALLAVVFLGAAALSSHWLWLPLLGLILFSVFRRARSGWLIPSFIGVGAVLVGLINFYYNYTHCWNNVLNGLFVPLAQGESDYRNLIEFFVVLTLFIGPWSIWYWRRCGARYTGIWQSEIGTLVFWSTLPLVLVLAVVSLWQDVGLYGPLLVAPILWLVFRALPEAALLGLFRWSASASLGLGLAIFLVVQSPSQWFAGDHLRSFEFSRSVGKACPAIEALPGPLFALDRDRQAVISLVCGREDVFVFAGDDKQSRQSDLHIDLRSLDSQQIIVLASSEDDLARIEPFFESLASEPLDGSGGGLIVRGNGFRFDTYRQDFLQPMVRKFYEAPYWFPQPGACPVRERYGL